MSELSLPPMNRNQLTGKTVKRWNYVDWKHAPKWVKERFVIVFGKIIAIGTNNTVTARKGDTIIMRPDAKLEIIKGGVQ